MTSVAADLQTSGSRRCSAWLSRAALIGQTPVEGSIRHCATDTDDRPHRVVRHGVNRRPHAPADRTQIARLSDTVEATEITSRDVMIRSRPT